MNPEENNNGAAIQPPIYVDTDPGASAGMADSTGEPAETLKENNNVASGPDAIGTPIDPTSVTLVDADLGASKPVPQPEPTLKQVREWRAANFTVRHSTVNACGHKIDLRIPPSNANCWPCWEAFFSNSPEGVASVHDLLLSDGTKAVIAVHG